jgi:hypothetical protein
MFRLVLGHTSFLFIGYHEPFPRWRRGLKWPGLEADHLPPYSAQIKNEWSSTPTAYLHVIGRNDFTFYTIALQLLGKGDCIEVECMACFCTGRKWPTL